MNVILTNNPRVLEDDWNLELVPVEGEGLAPVFEKALEMAQGGYKLVSAPLPPNVPLIRAAYRSLILCRNTRQYDVESLRALEKAKERVESLGLRPNFTPDPKEAADAAYIDRDLLKRALREADNLQKN